MSALADVERHRARRLRVFDAMQACGGGVAVLPTAPLCVRNGGSEYPYRYDSSFWYLTGFGEPDSALVLIAHSGRTDALLFCRERDDKRELWDGPCFGPERAQATFGVDAAHPIGELDAMMPALLAGAPALFYPFARSAELDTRVQRWLGEARARAGRAYNAPATTVDLASVVDTLRLVKDDAELDAMRRAAQRAAAAHQRAMRACRPGMREYELEAELLHEFHRHGLQPAYGSIVAAGANACTLHHPAGDGVLVDGELVLVDAGCEVKGYASDVTRTFPVGGRFSAEQRAVYDIVLASQLAAIDAVRPGARFDDPHDVATRVLTQGLLDLCVITGTLDGAIESKAYQPFFMHRTGHWLGLDVHDVGATMVDEGGERRPRTLEAGMVTTVEPGLYFRANSGAPERFESIGVRIEDDVAVTENGNDVLSAAAPKHPRDIEALMAQRR